MAVISTLGSFFADGITASGISTSKPAISLSDPGVSGGLDLGPGIGRQSLKGWFLVKDPGGQLHIFQQIDLGPGSGTNPRRGIDYTQAALPHLGGGDPTNKQSQLVYLGMSETDIRNNLLSAVQQIGGDPKKIKDPGLYARAAMANGYVDLKNQPTNLSGGAINQIFGPGTAQGIGGLPTIADPLSGLAQIGSFFLSLMDPKHLLRILLVFLGIIGLIIGLIFLVKSGLHNGSQPQ